MIGEFPLDPHRGVNLTYNVTLYKNTQNWTDIDYWVHGNVGDKNGSNLTLNGTLHFRNSSSFRLELDGDAHEEPPRYHVYPTYEEAQVYVSGWDGPESRYYKAPHPNWLACGISTESYDASHDPKGEHKGGISNINLIYCDTNNIHNAPKVVHVDSRGTRGTPDRSQYCPPGTYINIINMKFDWDHKTGANELRFKCNSVNH